MMHFCNPSTQKAEIGLLIWGQLSYIATKSKTKHHSQLLDHPKTGLGKDLAHEL
jgi:hypothetical protein